MKHVKKLLFALLAAVAVAAILIFVWNWKVDQKKTEIMTSSSPDGTYSLKIYMIGEPDWPFGAAHCRFDLYQDNKRLTKYTFSIQDDGANASKDNFEVSWSDEAVTIQVWGSEQGMESFVLYFDGRVEV